MYIGRLELLIVIIILLVVLVAFIIWLVKRFTPDTRRASTPLEIAKERYAKGEISKEQLEEIKKNI